MGQHMGHVFRAYRQHPFHRAVRGARLTQTQLAGWLGISQAQVNRIENGSSPKNFDTLAYWAQVLRIPTNLLWFKLPGSKWSDADVPKRPSGPTPRQGQENSTLYDDGDSQVRSFADESAETFSPNDIREQIVHSADVSTRGQPGYSAEHLRSGLTEVLATTLLTEASIDDWEQIALRIGRATRFRPPGDLVSELTSNLGELRLIMTRARSEKLARRTARVAAQMSGLMSLCLIKLDDRAGSRNWVRTARLLAAETNDINLQSWVHAQEAYYHFYDKNLIATVDAARYAQYLEKNSPAVGSTLAAGVEARAYALLNQKQESMRAMKYAESYLSKLANEAMAASAFGYNEAQLRFHQGNALTHLRETTDALRIQDRALELCPEDDFLDRALVLLDRADCFAVSGEVSSAIELATRTVTALDSSQAQGMIANRAHDTLRALPASEGRRPDALELHEAITSLNDSERDS